jgi:opacity protein-like surface antigen
MKKLNFKYSVLILLAFTAFAGFAQKPYRVGTTAANFLEIGYGSAGNAMGDAFVSVANDLSALYWNPAGLAYMKQNEASFAYQPWLVNINTSFAGVGMVVPQLGTFALGLIQVGYGDMEVTTMEMQNGTGEVFNASDVAVSLGYARKLAQWFSFGASAKYISSKIWHSNASAMAIDLGVLVNTEFFSMSGKREDGMTIGMSISNYGTKMKYDGLDLLHPIDILPYEQGNYRDVPGKFSLEAWELPLIFRIGFSVHPLVLNNHRLTLAVDALHPNNNMESVNIGAQYKLTIPAAGDFYLRGGYKALFMENSEFGLALGAGMTMRLLHNMGLKFEYAYRGIGILGKTHAYTIGFLF